MNFNDKWVAISHLIDQCRRDDVATSRLGKAIYMSKTAYGMFESANVSYYNVDIIIVDTEELMFCVETDNQIRVLIVCCDCDEATIYFIDDHLVIQKVTPEQFNECIHSPMEHERDFRIVIEARMELKRLGVGV